MCFSSHSRERSVYMQFGRLAQIGIYTLLSAIFILPFLIFARKIHTVLYQI